MQFRILGSLEAYENGRPVRLGSERQRVILAVLLLHAGEVVSSDHLIDALWGEGAPEGARKTLQVYVSRLRKLLGPETLVTHPAGYSIEVAPQALDLVRFEHLRAEARAALEAGDAVQAAARLSEALAEWRGPPLAEFTYEAFAQPEIARLEELQLLALEERIEADIRLGRHADVAAELEGLIGRHPLRERLRGQLMLCLYRSGRQAEALDAFQAARRALVEELGIEPGRELRELHEAILRQDPSLELAGPAAATAGCFEGRASELAELAAGLDDARAGRGRLFLLVGEPGIGKSRLAEEAMALARARGMDVLVGRCWEAGGAPAYWPWVQALRSHARETDADALRAQLGPGTPELAQLLPELRTFVPDLPEPSPLDSEGARFRLFDAVAELLRSASEARPLLLVLDDLHAADAPSLMLLRFLVRGLGSNRMVVLGACRDVDPAPNHALTEMLAEVARESLTHRLALSGLSEDEVAEYVELTASGLASRELVAMLHEETEGNPLFVGEIARLVALEGVKPESLRADGLGVPQSVRDVIARRLTHLSERCRELLVLACVLGREFSLRTLARLGAIGEDELLDALDEAVAARVVSEVPGAPGRLRFAHVLIRDTLYGGLTSTRRVRTHRRVVEALEALYGDAPGPHLGELAHHAIAGSDPDRGARYARLAGDWTLGLLAYEEAARHYGIALDTLGPADARARCEVLLALGEAHARAGDTAAARQTFLEAAELARGEHEARLLALAAAGYGGRIVWARAGEDALLVPLLEEGLAALPQADVELRTRLLARLAGALRDEPSRERRDALSREAVDLARRAGDPAALAYALDGRVAAVIGPDTIDECLALATELCEVARRSGDMERLAIGHSQRLMTQLMRGDVTGAQADLATMGRLANQLKQPARAWEVCSSGALLALAAGRLDDADRLRAEAVVLGERSVRRAAVAVDRLQRYALCDLRGTPAEAESWIRELVTEYPARPVFRCALAHLCARAGLLPEARQLLTELAAGDFAALPFDQEWLYAMSLLAEACAGVGDVAVATELARRLSPYAELNGVDVGEGFRGSLHRYLGQLATTTREWSEAERHFERAIEMNAAMGARPLLALTQDDYARMLSARAEDGDAQRSGELSAVAAATYGELGMSPARA
jgi:DNA-binding SARP family transcriptional activator